MSRTLSSLLVTAVAALSFAAFPSVTIANSNVSDANNATFNETSSTRSAAICRPLQVRNTKGARSYTTKGLLIRCAGADGKAAQGAPYCTADLP